VLAIGALSSLWLTLMASVRRRRKDLAVLKTLGFTRRQLAATVAWQATAAVTAGIVAGIPLGIALGRYLWDLFARQISVVPEPTVPAMTAVVVTLGALATANLVAALPAPRRGQDPRRRPAPPSDGVPGQPRGDLTRHEWCAPVSPDRG
jgi:ABC-type lipoprotein release transport system permease subunit